MHQTSQTDLHVCTKAEVVTAHKATVLLEPNNVVDSLKVSWTMTLTQQKHWNQVGRFVHC